MSQRSVAGGVIKLAKGVDSQKKYAARHHVGDIKKSTFPIDKDFSGLD